MNRRWRRPIVRRGVVETISGSWHAAAFETSPADADCVLWKAPFAQEDSPDSEPTILLRVQFHCLLSTAFSSTMCDCGEQVRRFLDTPASRRPVLVYLNQEGRGHGLAAKFEVIRYMNEGLSLRQAQLASGRPSPYYDYTPVLPLLKEIGLADVPAVVATRSVDKARALRRLGVRVVGQEDA